MSAPERPAARAPARWDRWVDPIAFKDLLSFARSPGGAGGRLMGALLLGAPVLVFAWALASAPGPWRFAARPLFLGIAALLAFFPLAVAVPAAMAFSLERDRNTLEGLVVSPLGPWRLALGKLLASVAAGLIVKAAVLPALALAYALGGGELSFVPPFLLLLLTVDVSLASLALGLGAREREARAGPGWLKPQASQAQLALQATVAISAVASLIPIYAAMFLVPLAVSHGERVTTLLDVLAPLGALHPLAALLVWGDAQVIGVGRVPVWALGVTLHALLALPLLADCVEALRGEAGAAPARLPRLLALPALAFAGLLLASVAVRAELPWRAVSTTLFAALTALAVAGRTGFRRTPGQRLEATPAAVVAGLWPPRALESTPTRAPGYALLVTLGMGPLVVWGGGGGGSAAAALGALALSASALAALGLRLAAGQQAREDEAFLAELDRPADAPGERPDGGAEQEDASEAPRGGARVLFALLAATILLPALAGVGLELGRAGVGGLAVLAPLFAAAASLGLALNPLTALIPILADPRLSGSDLVLRALETLGLAPSTVFALHLLASGLLLLGAVATLPRPLDVEQALRERSGPAA